jgi:hypothetical protein
MTDDPGLPPQSDDERINIDDEADVARRAEELCTTPEELRAAVQAVGPRVGTVKGYLLMALVRRRKD